MQFDPDFLVRTSTEVRKQKGITFLCAQMDTLGITVDPIITIDGRHSLNRVTNIIAKRMLWL